MKVLVVTIYNSLNYGAYLQGYGLYRVFKDMGHDVKMYTADPHDIKFYIHALHLRSPQEVLYNMGLLKSFYNSWNEMDRITNLEEEYDLAVIGSDELWNVHNVNFEHSDIYIGRGIKAKKICTYAISGNDTSAKEFADIYGKNALQLLDRIAVRDKFTYELVNSFAKTKPIMVVDPTLLYNFELTEEKIEEKYIVVYGYYFEEKEKQMILEYAHRQNIKLVSAGFVHKWCDKIFTGKPIKFLGLINKAEGVISATFHGTILSMKYNKKLAVFNHSSQKIIDALSRFSMMGCSVSDDNSIDSCFEYSSNYSTFNRKLEAAVFESKEYLNEVLNI